MIQRWIQRTRSGRSLENWCSFSPDHRLRGTQIAGLACRLHGNVAGFDLRKWSRCIRIIGARLGNNEIGDFAIDRHELPFAHASARAANVAGCGSVVVVANLLGRLKRLDADPDWAGQRHTIEADVRL